MTHHVYCFDCASNYDQVGEKPDQCGSCGSVRVGVLTEASKPNVVARSGYDRCFCGNKYFEVDHCIDCGKHVTEIPVCPAEGCNERDAGKPCWEHLESVKTALLEGN